MDRDIRYCTTGDGARKRFYRDLGAGRRVSNAVRDLARASAGVSFEGHGGHDLKGSADPIHVFSVCGDQR